MERTKRGASARARTALALLGAAFLVATSAGGIARAEPGARVDLNSATAAELETLPGVGPSKAQAIIAHREVEPFKSTEELVEVKGIGDKLYAQLKDHVTVSAAPASAARARAQVEPGGAGADAKTARSGSTAGAR